MLCHPENKKVATSLEKVVTPPEFPGSTINNMSIEQAAPPIRESTSSTNSLLSSSNTSRLGGLSNSFNSRGNNNGNSSTKGRESATSVDDNFPPPVINQKPTSNYNNCDDILKHSLSMVDLIFGIYGIELWHYDEQSGKLVIVNLDESQDDEETGNCSIKSGGGILLKRKPQETDSDNDYATSEAVNSYNKLTDPSHPSYIHVNSTDPGVGLAGALWAESSSMGSSEGGMNFNRAGVGWVSMGTIQWRDVCELANDPDQVRYNMPATLHVFSLLFSVYYAHTIYVHNMLNHSSIIYVSHQMLIL